MNATLAYPTTRAESPAESADVATATTEGAIPCDRAANSRAPTATRPQASSGPMSSIRPSTMAPSVRSSRARASSSGR